MNCLRISEGARLLEKLFHASLVSKELLTGLRGIMGQYSAGFGRNMNLWASSELVVMMMMVLLLLLLKL